jgi:bifunctional DNA-binding transcriptional regulator/antitoxin component of YhaV-PrlF toxin-antitoxin module
MAAIIEETSTITAKGQTTVPKAVRQVLGVNCGGKIAYGVHNPEPSITIQESPRFSG